MSYRYSPDDVWPADRATALKWRPSWIFIALVLAFAGSAVWMYLNGSSDYGQQGFSHLNPAVFIFIISGWVLSLCLHEFGHALLAFRAGDRDIEARGYLTLDPRKYTHPFLSIILPLLFVALGGIGLPGGAVWVNHAHIRGSRLRHAMISLIGPLINLGFAIVLGIAFLFVSIESVDAHRDFWASVGFLAILQFTAALLNILPIPGLDGGNAIEPYLNDEWKRGFAHVRPYGMLLVLALLWSPRANDWFFGLVFDLAAQFNIGAGSYFIGRALFWPFPGLF